MSTRTRGAGVTARRAVGAILALAVSTWLAVAAAEAGLLSAEHATPQHPHASSLATSDGSVVGHAHVGRHVVPSPPDAFTAVGSPRVDAALAALHLEAARMVTTTSLATTVSPAMRGPPVFAPIASWGRRLLIEFCIARR